MGCFRRCGDGGRQLPCNALSCVPLVVIFWLLFMATTVTARLLANVSRSVSSAVQEPLLTDELAALREIADALHRNVELLSNNWSWIKVGLLSFGVLFLIEVLKIYTGFLTQYLVDRRRDASANQMETKTADADREGNQTSIEIDRLEEGLKEPVVDLHHRDSPSLLPPLKSEASTEKGKEALITAAHPSSKQVS